MDIIDSILQYHSIFSKSFYSSALKKHGVGFSNSNILEIKESLIRLRHSIDNDIIIDDDGKMKLTISDIELVIKSLDNIIEYYKECRGITTLPSKLTDKEMIADVTKRVMSNKINVKDLAKEVVKEVLNPINDSQKLNKKEQMKLDAAAKTRLENLKLIQKQPINSK